MQKQLFKNFNGFYELSGGTDSQPDEVNLSAIISKMTQHYFT